MSPVPRFAQGAVIARGFEKLGMHTAPLPLAVTTREYNGREACIWDGWCGAGCPIGALANPLTTDLPIAFAHGAVLRANATVSRILSSDTGEFVTGVEFSDEAGEIRQLMADLALTEPTLREQRTVLLEHYNLSVALHGEKPASRMMRKFGIKFAAHHPNSKAVKADFVQCRCAAEWHRVIDHHYGPDPATMTVPS